MEIHPSRKRTRLLGYDYATPGAYFVTVCTQNRRCIFELERVGNGPCAVPPAQNQIIRKWLKKAENKFVLSLTTIPPNGRKKTLNVGADSIRPPCIELNRAGHLVDDAIHQIPCRYPHTTVDTYCIMPDHVHMIITIHPDENGRQIAAPTLSTVAGQFKRVVSKQLGVSLWQKSFIERVIRNDSGYRAVWEYIENNPYKIDFADDPLHFDDLQ